MSDFIDGLLIELIIMALVAFITNRCFIDSKTFDGFRKCIADDFNYCFIIDTKSDVRENPKIAGTTHNVFGIQTGVAIMLLVKQDQKNDECKIHYIEYGGYLEKRSETGMVEKSPIKRDSISKKLLLTRKFNWLNQINNDFDQLIPLIDKKTKRQKIEKSMFQNLFTRCEIKKR